MVKNLASYQGHYLFHGSSNGDIKVLQPSQAMSFSQPDGAPAVHASIRLEPPIFMAVLGSKKLGGWGMKGKPGFGFYILDSDLEKARAENWIGYVYVLPKDGFTHKSEWEWISRDEVKPIDVVRVGIEDLPPNITVLSPDELNRYYDSRGR